MIQYPSINSVMLRIGPFSLRWYGFMFTLGFAASFFLVGQAIRKDGGKVGETRVPHEDLAIYYTCLIAGLLIGARLGYVFFYDLQEYLAHPLEIFQVWRGGMSFHGSFAGCLAADILWCRMKRVNAWRMADHVIATAPIGLGLGRIGNFINGELYGRVTDVPWAMVFPEGGPLPRHPSQLYELLLEGVLLYVVLRLLRKRTGAPGNLTMLFLVLYGICRIIAEFFREPDPQLGYILGPFTMGQVLSAVMVVIGTLVLIVQKSTEAQTREQKTRK